MFLNGNSISALGVILGIFSRYKSICKGTNISDSGTLKISGALFCGGGTTISEGFRFSFELPKRQFIISSPTCNSISDLTSALVDLVTF